MPEIFREGRLDADVIAAGGDEWVAAWLRARFTRVDPHVPLSKRGDEDAEAVIVDLCRRHGARAEVTQTIGRAALMLLDEIGANADTEFAEPLLRLCQRVVLPAVGSWFIEQMSKLEKRETGNAVQQDLAQEILLAAVTQVPPQTGSASEEIWLRLIDRPQFATVSWYALGRNLPDRLRHVVRWWNAASALDRAHEIKYLLFVGMRDNEPDDFLEFLHTSGATWPGDLRDAFDRELEQLGTSPIFRDSAGSTTLRSAIDGAARQRRFVLGAPA